MKNCDCSKCFYGLKSELGCGAFEGTTSQKIDRIKQVNNGDFCVHFKPGNKLFKEFTRKRKYKEKSFYDFINEKTKDDLCEMYKYFPDKYNDTPSMCIGFIDNEVYCDYRNDHSTTGCEFCWKKHDCEWGIKRETNIFERAKNKIEKQKRLIHVLIDIMIKLVILILILIYVI